MRQKSQKTAKQLRRANRGNVPGLLGMEEMGMLMRKATPVTTGEAMGHKLDASCWCQPTLEYIDPETGNAVYVHHKGS